jgi:hypothetical protein
MFDVVDKRRFPVLARIEPVFLIPKEVLVSP